MEQVTLMPTERLDRKSRSELDRLRDQRGDAAVAAAIRDVAERIPTQPPSARQVVMEVLKELEPFVNGAAPPKPKGYQPSSEEAQSAFRR